MVPGIGRGLLRCGRHVPFTVRLPHVVHGRANVRALSILHNCQWEYALQSSLFWPSNLVERLMEVVHMTTGLSWGPSILLYTALMRLALFPVNAMQVRASIKSLELRPNVQKLRAEMQEIASRNDATAQEKQAKAIELSNFMSKNGISPFRIMGGAIVQVPLFMSTFIAIQAMVNQPISGFTSERLLWLSDLSASDPTYILPAISTSILLMSSEVSRKSMFSTGTGVFMKLAMRLGALISFPFIAHMPAALVAYFAMSNLMTLAFNVMWLSDTARSAFRIPKRAIHAQFAQSAIASSASVISRVSAAKQSWLPSASPKIVSTTIYSKRASQ